MPEHEAKNAVQTSRMTFRVIEALEQLKNANLTEVAEYLGEPKSTVHNHLNTLVESCYLTKNSGTYKLGLRFTELGEKCKQRYPVYKVGEEEVEKLAAETEELANLAVEEHGRVVYLHRAEGQSSISTDTFAGKRVALHSTALGKAMLAFMEEERVEKIIDNSELAAETEHTITERGDLWEELESIKQNEVAYDDEERAYGIRCVAAPILAQNSKELLGAVSISAPKHRMKEERFTETFPEILQNAANVIQIELTYAD